MLEHNLVPTSKIDKDGNVIEKTTLMREYKLHKGGVKWVDQQRYGFSPLQKSNKWEKNLHLEYLCKSL